MEVCWAQYKTNFFLWVVVKLKKKDFEKATVLAVSECLGAALSIGHQKKENRAKQEMSPRKFKLQKEQRGLWL